MSFAKFGLAANPMRWTLRKCDAMIGTIVAALAGLACAQLPALIQQYLQRLGGHIDEARLNLSRIATSTDFRSFDATARETLIVSLQTRVNTLEFGEQAITGASASARPFIFARELDPEIAMATLRNFEPAVPLSTAGFVYAIGGMIAGWLLYELVKAPFGLAVRRRQPRPARERIEPY